MIFDPYLDGSAQDINDLNVEYIFVSHGHFDHLGSAIELAKACDATIISTAEVCGVAGEAGVKTHAMHLGGTHASPLVKYALPWPSTAAVYPAAMPAVLLSIFTAPGYTLPVILLYLVICSCWQRLDSFDYAVLPIGDNFTMGPKDAAIAPGFLKAKYVIPIHYNTWPLIAQDPVQFKADVEAHTASKVLIVEPGASIELA